MPIHVVDSDQLHRELTATSKHLALLGDIAQRQGLAGVARNLRTAEDAVDGARAGVFLRAGGKRRHGKASRKSTARRTPGSGSLSALVADINRLVRR